MKFTAGGMSVGQSFLKCFGNACEDLKNIHISQAIQNREKRILHKVAK